MAKIIFSVLMTQLCSNGYWIFFSSIGPDKLQAISLIVSFTSSLFIIVFIGEYISKNWDRD